MDKVCDLFQLSLKNLKIILGGGKSWTVDKVLGLEQEFRPHTTEKPLGGLGQIYILPSCSVSQTVGCDPVGHDSISGGSCIIY